MSFLSHLEHRMDTVIFVQRMVLDSINFFLLFKLTGSGEWEGVW